MEYLEGIDVDVLPWIPKGCDISIIENVWSPIKHKLYERSSELKSKNDVWRIASEYFMSEEIDVLIKKLYKTMNKRVTALKKAKGSRVCFK